MRRLGISLIILGVAVFAGGLITAWNYGWYDEANPTTKVGVASSSPAATPNDVQIDGWIDDRRLVPGAVLKFWVVVQNPLAAKEIGNIEIVALRRPNLTIPAGQRRCWKTEAGEMVPACQDTTGPASPKLPSGKVGPGGSITIEGNLVAGDDHGRFGLTAVVGWIDAAQTHRRKLISIAPITVESPWQARVTNLAKLLQMILKDFALPLVLLWLGFLIKKLETEREENRKASEDRVARVQQTWNLMLPKLHENTEKHYLPLMRHAESVRKYHAAQPEYTFFFYAAFLAQMKQMIDAISGFYLKDVDGEDVVSRLWEALMDEADSAAWFGRPIRERLQSAVDPGATYVEFQSALREHTVQEARKAFLARSAAFAEQLPIFGMFSTALWFETNVCYVFWYGKPPAFPSAEFRKELVAFKGGLGASSRYKELTEFLHKYADAAEARVRALERDTYAN